MSKSNLSYKNFIAYLKNRMQNKERHIFEKEIMCDAFEQEALDGLYKVNASDLEQDIISLKQNIDRRTKTTRTLIPTWLHYAAGILLLLGVATSIFFFSDLSKKTNDIKEQLSESIVIADSIATKTYEEINKTINKDTIVYKNLIADKIEPEKKEKKKKKIVSIEYEEEDIADDIEISEDILEQPQTENITRSIRIEEEKELFDEKSKTEIYSEEETGITIKGRVINDKNLPVPGVSVVDKDDNSIGTQTDIDGNFILNLASDSGSKTIVVQSIGLKSEEISIEKDSTILVNMESDYLVMDEVVVTAYGESIKTQKAQPPQGLSLKEYKQKIIQTINYSKLSGIKGKYRLKILLNISQSGDIELIEFRNSTNKLLEQSVEQAIMQIGNWQPTIKRGLSVESIKKFTLKIKIR
ncbi:MAG: carboxypeptidase-like regulatory domain-containing protein [Bacteroidales bacterium]|nr:carboxypeptidase-like regulatory domain-containing protein [Bacteroidales bacterium]